MILQRLSLCRFCSSCFSEGKSFAFDASSRAPFSVFSATLLLKRLPLTITAIFHHSGVSVAAISEAAPIEAEKREWSKSEKVGRSSPPDSHFRRRLDMCSKKCDLQGALRLYDDARSKGIPLSQYHYNALLYICSSSPASNGASIDAEPHLGYRRGFEIYHQMGAEKIHPNEATFTNMARIAAALDDPDMAFGFVTDMATSGIVPKLRSYGAPLFGFCRKGEMEKAYEVLDHMEASGVSPEEPELAAVLQLSVDAGQGDRVYRLLHLLRSKVRRVSEATAEIIERWFKSDAAMKIGETGMDVVTVREGVVKGGGGWHGQGWLGSGYWRVARTQIDDSGFCGCCREKLVCVDIDPVETENFARSLSKLACQKEATASFSSFQEWLVHHGPFEAIIDGANVGIYNENKFSFNQLNSVVTRVSQMNSSKKLPLIVLHNGRLWSGPAQHPSNKQLIQSWRKSGVLYTVPTGSNDDWYWLYAAVSSNCLLVTNDEMRDHLFQLLGTSFFPRWKEKHQVRVTFLRRVPTLHMPPPYSIVIQESEAGGWHVPIITGNEVETKRQWICATRARPRASLSSQFL